MDEHYGQVMRARAELAAQRLPARRYFAYSTILDREAFLEWRAQHGYAFFDLPGGQLAEALDVELAWDFPSRWWGGRVAGLGTRAGAVVHGRLFDIAAEDWPVIQHKEGFITRMAVEREVKVRAGGVELAATAFATHPERQRSDGPISERFVAALARGVRAAGLPPDWVAKIEAIR